MIYECPKCNTTHSKSEREIGAGLAVKCRRCAYDFWVSTAGVREIEAEQRADARSGAGSPAPPAAFTDAGTVPVPTAAWPKPEASEFHQARTEVMAIPVGVNKPIPARVAPVETSSIFDEKTMQATPEQLRAGLAAMQAEPTVPEQALPDPTRPDGAVAEPAADVVAPAMAPRSSSRGSPVAEAPLDEFDDVEGGEDEAATRVSAASEISDMLQRITGEQRKVDASASAAPPSAVVSPAAGARSTGDRLALSQPLGDLEGSVSDGGELDHGFGVTLDDEYRPGRPRTPAAASSSAKMAPARGGRAAAAFPVAELQAWAAGRLRSLRGQPVALQVMAGVVAVLGIVVLILIAVAILGEADRSAFVDADTALMSGPGDQTPYEKISTLTRGEEVTRFPAGDWGEWVMVRSLMGQAGFVHREVVTEHRPAATVGTPFAGCRRSPLEEDVNSCRTRGQVQLGLCRDACDALEQEESCVDQCQRQFEDCLRGCEGKSSPAVAKPQPIVEDIPDGTVGEDVVKKPVKKPAPAPRPKKKRKR